MVIGTPTNIAKAWKTKIRTFKEEIRKYTSYTLTYNAKAILLKSKLLPQLAFIAQVYPLPAPLTNEITNSTENFVTGNVKLKIHNRHFSTDIKSRRI